MVIQHIESAADQVDYAISEAVRLKKPAYIEVCCLLCLYRSLYCPPACTAAALPACLYFFTAFTACLNLM